ncbi:muscle, skeletal receptor tyrosine protein kinase-like [Tubulanus polymorphus]|uniref:muscle, skeletal receptor tyrosine protein kinase-like n=1 Tax=Tubulanus polymorphus TaxID=672921 RepID=UPI003DA56B4F
MKILILLLCMILQLLPATGLIGDVIEKEPTNCTVLVDSKTTLNCQVTQNNTQVIWQKGLKNRHYYELPRKGPNFRMLRSGSLRFHRVRMSDQGWYRCIVQNSHGVKLDQSDYVFLTVQAVVEIPYGRAPQDRRVNYGTEIEIKCEAVGKPMPNVSWTKNGQVMAEEENKFIIKVNVTESAVYGCTAVNTVNVKGKTVIQRSAKITIINSGICMSYSGSACENVLGTRSVFIDKSFHDMELIEKTASSLRDKLTKITKRNPYCKKTAESFLCHHLFPDCDNSLGDARAAPVCREECQVLKDLYCQKEWTSLLNDVKQNKPRVEFPECDDLPMMKNDSSPCSVADIYQPDPVLLTSDCYHDNGSYYNGTINVTKTGRRCLMWSHQWLHTAHPQIFPELINAQNYCRNPGGYRLQPWCYYSYTEKEDCNVPECGLVDKVTGKEPSLDLSTVIIISVVSGVIILVMCISIIALYRCHFSNQHTIRYDVTPADDDVVELNLANLRRNVIYHKSSSIPTLNPKLDYLEYPRNNIVYLQDIGQGAYGRVFKASCPGLVTGQDATLVAVKMLKDDATVEMQNNFEREASLMTEFHHPNIVRLLGVCAIGKPMCLLFEFMVKGDLNEFLRLCGPDYAIAHSHESYGQNAARLNLTEQLSIGAQIASAMLYLSKKGYVHRDLATRNCLVGGENITVKISDFGLTRAVNSNGECYRGSDQDALAIRWMPLESILYNEFSHKSDVWSFGVFLWEIFSFAQQPYFEIVDHEDVINFVKDGNVMERPENTPERVYGLMKECWNLNSEHRPSFQAVYRSLRELFDRSYMRSELT